MAFFIEDQLRCGIESSRALALVLVVEFEDAGGEVERLRLSVEESFTEADLPIGDEDDLASGRGWSHFDVGAVVAERAGDLDVTHSLHLLQCVDETLILPLFESLDEINPVSRRREFVDVQGDTYVLA